MNAPVYTRDILRLAASIPFAERLTDADASVEKRSMVCGSRVSVDVTLNAERRVEAIGMVVRACALGQASAALLRGHAVGRTPEELAAARDGLAAWLAGDGAMPDWPGIDIFAAALPLTARHASIRLAFEAAADAAAQAQAKHG